MSPATDRRGLQRRVRRVGDEATALADGVEDALDELTAFVREQAAARPYASVAVAGGLGYVLGGGVPVAMVRQLVTFGSRIAMAQVVHRLLLAPQPPSTPE